MNRHSLSSCTLTSCSVKARLEQKNAKTHRVQELVKMVSSMQCHPLSDSSVAGVAEMENWTTQTTSRSFYLSSMRERQQERERTNICQPAPPCPSLATELGCRSSKLFHTPSPQPDDSVISPTQPSLLRLSQQPRRQRLATKQTGSCGCQSPTTHRPPVTARGPHKVGCPSPRPTRPRGGATDQAERHLALIGSCRLIAHAKRVLAPTRVRALVTQECREGMTIEGGRGQDAQKYISCTQNGFDACVVKGSGGAGGSRSILWAISMSAHRANAITQQNSSPIHLSPARTTHARSIRRLLQSHVVVLPPASRPPDITTKDSCRAVRRRAPVRQLLQLANGKKRTSRERRRSEDVQHHRDHTGECEWHCALPDSCMSTSQDFFFSSASLEILY
ncbi:hypothetical protein C0Q70_11576 [Pomacea canaliculata]|uniref:Uncharacterized protein n=1 Tax=Pomacea canaliculata TaxID=400727 RepID=A0A2T7P6D7_POMCA|nr:hypothetical protein C0Q70_11576 [Pomacea canaliculata]